MFSRALVVHKGLSNAVAQRMFAPLYVQRTKTSSTEENKAVDISDPNVLIQRRKEVELLLKEELPKPYDGPERDLVNFPRRVRPTEPGKVRMGFIPDEWFQFFYKKTGVTGPYVFGAGLVTFLLSKELYVIEHEFSTGCALFFLAYIAVKKFGEPTKKYLDQSFVDEVNRLEKGKKSSMKSIEDAIAAEKKEIWYAEGQKILLEAKRENVQMQLEAEYRKRMMHIYEEVKKRLDYQLDMYNTKRKMEQKHMVDWIVNSVVKSITPQQEKEALQKCIEDLKVLSSR